MSITKVQINRATVGNLSGSRSFTSSSLASRVTTEATNVDNLQTDSGSFSTRITNLVTASSSFSGSIATLRGAGSLQGVGTSDSPTFAGATITGTLTAQEIHTEFESASILFSSGSTIFGDTSNDTHRMTGSLNISGAINLNDGDAVFGATATVETGLNLESGTFTVKNATSDSNGLKISQGGSDASNILNHYNGTLNLGVANSVDMTLKGGLVGIGTNNPTSTSQLHVEAAKAEIRIKGTNDSASDEIAHLILEASTDRRAGITIEGDSNDIQAFMGRPYDTANTLVFETDATERQRITSAGKVGIGSNDPDGTLDVMAADGYAYFTTTSPAAFNMIFRSGSADPQNNWLGQIEFTGASGGTSQIVTRNNNELALGVNNSHKLTLETNNDIKVESGDIVFGSSGRGIVLGNTSNADANTLDDYEEGTWTPVPYYQNASDQTVAENNDSNALGRYVVVGKQVTLWGAVQVDMSSTSITFDNFGIKGLPFSTANITNYRAVGCFAYSNSNVADEDTAFTISMGPNQNHMHVQQQDGTGNMAQNFGNSSNMELFGTITFLLP